MAVVGRSFAQNGQIHRLAGESSPAAVGVRRRVRPGPGHLLAGNSYEVNLTYRLEQASELTPVETYLRLRELNPAPYAGFLQHDLPGARGWLLSSSPERYALVTEDRTLETKPIKGTTPRAEDPDEDERQRHELETHPRFRAENLMIVDLLRNDLSMVCEAGHRGGAGADGGRVLHRRAPAGLHGPRPAPRRRLHPRGAARASSPPAR